MSPRIIADKKGIETKKPPAFQDANPGTWQFYSNAFNLNIFVYHRRFLLLWQPIFHDHLPETPLNFSEFSRILSALDNF
jgi:hypothetical protein